MSEICKDALVDAIRNAKTIADLNELKRMVGPSQAQLDQSRDRLSKVDAVWKRCEKQYGSDKNLWPEFDREIFEQLSVEQHEFENLYL